MRLRVLGYALLAGVAGFLVVGVAVTELLAPRIEFSLFLGIPAGLVAGAAAAAFVLFGLGSRRDPAIRALALGTATFGGALVVVLVAASVLLSVGLLIALAAGVVVGIAAGIGVGLRERQRASEAGPADRDRP